MKTLTRIFLISLSWIILSIDAYACKMSRDPKSNFFVSFENGPIIGSYGDGATSVLPSNVYDCRTEAGKFLMFTSGVRSNAVTSDLAEISFDGNLNDNKCRIQDGLFKNPLNFNQRKLNTNDQYRFLRSCTYIDVADTTGKQIRFTENQKACSIKVLSPGVVRLTGDYCFIQIDPNYNLSVTLGINPECADKEFLKKTNLNPRDIEAVVNAYVTGDETGLSTEVDAIGTRRYRVTIQPHSKHLPLSEDQGIDQPRFPTTYNAEIHIGEISVIPLFSNRSAIEVSYSVDNRGTDTCFEGLCTNPSKYNIPVVSEVSLYEQKNNSKLEYIDGWMTAGIAESNWQGLLKSSQHTIDAFEFEVGKSYVMVSDFIDPFDDYQLFLKYKEQILIDLKGANGVAGLDSISSLQPLAELYGIPLMPGLPGLTSSDLNAELERVLRFFKTLGSDKQWPIYYESLCDSQIASCKKSGKNKFWVKLTTSFTIASKDEFSGKLILSNIRVKKETTENTVYEHAITSFPKYLCE